MMCNYLIKYLVVISYQVYSLALRPAARPFACPEVVCGFLWWDRRH